MKCNPKSDGTLGVLIEAVDKRTLQKCKALTGLIATYEKDAAIAEAATAACHNLGVVFEHYEPVAVPAPAPA